MSSEKKTKKRWLWKIVGGVVVLLVVLIVVVLIFLNSIIAGAVRTVGGKATGTRVGVDSIQLSVFGGSLAIKELQVANPDGFQMPDALGFTALNVKLQIGSVMSDKIIVDLVEISGLNIDYELTVNGSNLGMIQKNIEKFVAEVAPPKDQPAAPEPEGKTKQVVIRKLIVQDGSLTLANKMLGQNIKIALPKIEMDNLGEGRNYPEMIAQFFNELLLNISRIITNAKLPDFDVEAFQNNLTANLNEAFQGVGKSLNDVRESVEGVGDSVREGLDKLFSKPKNQ
ncbi:hypothetical protein [Victivallis sp. Marseille-Q1083]|uniref:DUF748 domain-containing protein n=1 Tax=Victivallis sp. Marseille-Q1083 TaxID=2717288 RepID=UPI00158C84CD|nr:hypothetical protein [Victivallis sp. Marseille-Q1083]